MSDDDDADPVTELLLETTKNSNNDYLINDSREDFNSDMIVLLLGLGLKGDEVQLFQKHKIGMDKFISLTNCDLDYIGISSSDKKKKIMSCINKIQRQQTRQSIQAQEESSAIEYRSDDFQALENVCRHQQTLMKILPCMKKYITCYQDTTFFQTGISSNHTFERVTLCCVEQTKQTQQQLALFLRELNQGKISKQWYLQTHLYIKSIFLSFLLGSCLSLVIWNSKK